MKISEFLEQPNTSIWIVSQEGHKDYKISRDKKEVYRVVEKVAATKSEYSLKKGNETLGSVKHSLLGNAFTYTKHGNEVGKITIGEEITLLYDSNTYKCKPELRSKDFAFYNDNKLVFTIDKSRLSLNDKYKVVVLNEIEEIIPILTAIVLDDKFHAGLK